ncbi:MAG: bifunctional phosphoribosylaminoimidazolecarboxamide formyltransferase/IMP cyclohydrolase [Bacteroidota bacterium]|nr:bifunctional phosphoribosylaminoimidazolecarboxamide formyltransferase/IMP cyclohydrolase [Bacteroidota bacterium]
MSDLKRIKSALISVYYKDKLADIVAKLKEFGVKIYSTGGTKSFIEELGVEVTAVEDLTTYPSILGGRVKTLHPKVFGGILARRDNESDQKQMEQYAIPEIDLVIVDLYPFEETVASGAPDGEIIEKIDIGGISLIRAAAKNFNDVIIVPSVEYYQDLLNLLNEKNGESSLDDRRYFAKKAFAVSSHYDSAIYKYFAGDDKGLFRESYNSASVLRYGENPHQQGIFYGNLEQMFDQLHGKEISYNNLLDIDAAISLIDEFDETTVAILKHNNACGCASRTDLVKAWQDALAGDPVSAYGGVIVTNRVIDKVTAEEMNKIFFEVVIAPGFGEGALDILQTKKNRIILLRKEITLPKVQYRTVLNGVLFQDKDQKKEKKEELTPVTKLAPSAAQIEDLLFANKLVKNSKSNSIVLARGKQLIASGIGETSRVDALKHAIEKAHNFEFDLAGAVMASDAFFPFADCVEIAQGEGVDCVIHPGGSIRDKDSVEFCDAHNMSMAVTGFRHFKH